MFELNFLFYLSPIICTISCRKQRQFLRVESSMMGDTFLEKIRRSFLVEFEEEGGAGGDEFFLKFGAVQMVLLRYSASTSTGDL